MTPQEIDSREERGDDRLSTSELAAARHARRFYSGDG